jgi:hypothetical protein
MKSVCLKCNRPLEQHQRVTAAFVESVKNATYDHPINGCYSPLCPSTIGQWMNHEPMMSTKPITWATPFGTTEVAV